MRRLTFAALVVAAAIAALASTPAAACIAFNYKAEMAAIDAALPDAKLSESELAEVGKLRAAAARLDRQARRLNDGSKIVARDTTVANLLKKLKLERIARKPAPKSGPVLQARSASAGGCG
jgi:hypothetical protein